jgi:hypothetical protein
VSTASRIAQIVAPLAWPPRVDWRRAAVQGAVLGLVTPVLSFPAQALWLALDSAGAAGYFLLYYLKNALGATAIAGVAQWVEGRLRWPALVMVYAALIALMTPVHIALIPPQPAALGDFTLVAGLTAHVWFNLTYGVAFAGFCLATQRTLRVRGLLARAELARERSLAEINQVRADAMSARVDPALLLRTLAAAQQAYPQAPAHADALLDALADFLRLAMPAVRSGRSTLRAELALLRSHARLLAALEPGRGEYSVAADLSELDIPFPPRLLIPMVEAATAAACPPQVALTAERGWLKLTLAAGAGAARDWIDDELTQRLERALQGLDATQRARVEVGASPCCLTLWLPPAALSRTELRHHEQEKFSFA